MQAAAPLPTLRQDLALLPGGADEYGAPSWLIHDPLCNRYFRIGALAFTLLRHWGAQATPQQLIAEASQAGHAATPEDITEVAGFLQQNGLARIDDAPARERLLTQYQAQKQRWSAWLIHHYLFFRIPLLRPDRFLQKTLPAVLPFFSTTARLTILLLGFLGLLLATRQWEQFKTTFLHFFSLEGLALYAITLGGIKCLHELGHAYTAKRFGCRVPSMGVAFLVMLPMPYTDVTDAWRLTDRKQRLAISTAGIRMELALALIATFLWSFLPDGALRSSAFFVATTSWIASLAINASPFMRFDGYYALMDWLGTDNLQARSFALARWRLRELLFDLREPAPEKMPTGRRRLFIGYAWTTWIYRITVFLGIALLVYYFAFKVLGILLFAVEIGWFILLPVQQELRAWWQRRKQIPQRPRARWSLFWLVLLGLLFTIPWQQTITLPAVVEAARFGVIYPPKAGIVSKVFVARGANVREQEPLILLESPNLKLEATQTARRIALLQQRIQRQAGSPEDLAQLSVLKRELVTQQTALRYSQIQDKHLLLRAPFAGRIHDLAELQPGQWVAAETQLAEMLAPGAPRAYAYIEESQLARIKLNAKVRFISHDGLQPPLQLTIAAIDTAAIVTLPYAGLASEYGGQIATRPLTGNSELHPEKALYRITLTPIAADEKAPPMQLFGTARVEAKAESLLNTLWRSMSATLVRESGF